MLTRPHGANAVFAAKKSSVQIGGEHGMPILYCYVLRVLRSGTLKAGNAGIVRNDVELPAVLQIESITKIQLDFRRTSRCE
jgi:hypothetical protein